MTVPSRLRAAAIAVAIALLVVVLWRATAADRAAALGGSPTLADLVTALAGVVVVVALAWLGLLVVLIALEPVAGRRLTGWAACPAGLRRLLLVLCGVAAASALALPAQAAGSGDDGSGRQQVSALLDGLPMPDRPSGAATPGADDTGGLRPAAARTVHETATHGVRPGDTLWDIAAKRLDHPRPAATERAWRVIYAANRDVIGTDPDLIHPGTTLRVPSNLQEDQP